MNIKHTFPLLVLSIFILSACQPGLPPERPINTGDRPRVTRNTTPVEEVLPTFAVTSAETKSEMKLRSQTSRYLNAQSSVLEITLTSSRLAYCQNENPALGEGEEELKITIKSKDGKTAIVQDELANNDGIEIAGVYRNNQGDIPLQTSDFSSMKIIDLNSAIVRGNLQIATTDLSIEGEFFTAICK